MSDSPEVDELRRMYVFLIAWLACVFVVYFFGSGDQTFLLYASDIISPTSAFLPAFYSVTLVRRYGFSRKDRFTRLWVYTAAGLLLWLLGELTWSVYGLFLGVSEPYPSVADVFWIAGYLPLVVALLAYMAPFKGALSLKSVLLAVGVALLADVVVFSVLIGPVFGPSADPATRLVDFAYPLLDMLLLGLAIAGMLLFLPGRISRFWVWLNVGMIFIAIADVLFSYTSALETYYTGHPLELFYFLGDAAILLGLYEHTRALHTD